MPKVSVIIPCYNLGEYLEEAVESVLNQTYQDFEIIIVNDGSTDEFTNQLLKNATWAKITIYHTPNQGLPATRNYGIERALGEYICCLDADDKYHPEFLEKTVKVLDDDVKNQYGFVTTWVQLFGETEKIWETSDYDPVELLFQNVIHVASMFRRKCWEEVGGYAVNLTGYQDWNFWIGIVSKGYKWATLKEELFYYRVRKNSMVTVSDSKRPKLFKQIVDLNIEIYKNNISLLLEKFVFLNIYKDEMIRDKDEMIRDKDEMIKSLYDSYTWKIGALLLWFPKTSLRFFKNIFKNK